MRQSLVFARRYRTAANVCQRHVDSHDFRRDVERDRLINTDLGRCTAPLSNKIRATGRVDRRNKRNVEARSSTSVVEIRRRTRSTASAVANNKSFFRSACRQSEFEFNQRVLNKRKQNSPTWQHKVVRRWCRSGAKAVGVETVTKTSGVIIWRREEASAARGSSTRAERTRRVNAQIHKRALLRREEGKTHETLKFIRNRGKTLPARTKKTSSTTFADKQNTEATRQDATKTNVTLKTQRAVEIQFSLSY